MKKRTEQISVLLLRVDTRETQQFHSSFHCCAGFCVMNVAMQRVGARKLVFIGGSLLALSAILSSLADQLMLIICLQAVLLGKSPSLCFLYGYL